jgi:multimeric flavodoxin WrbA
MKTLILNGSPRRYGNTSTLGKNLVKHMKESDYEILNLGDYQVSPCTACDGCVSSGLCVHKDDTNELLTKVNDATTLVFATPIYWWGMTAQLKCLIDKFYTWQSQKYKLDKKSVGLITVGGADTTNIQYQLVKDQIACICEFLSWNFIFDQAFSAYEIGEVEKNAEQIKTVTQLGQTHL